MDCKNTLNVLEDLVELIYRTELLMTNFLHGGNTGQASQYFDTAPTSLQDSPAELFLMKFQ